MIVFVERSTKTVVVSKRSDKLGAASRHRHFVGDAGRKVDPLWIAFDQILWIKEALKCIRQKPKAYATMRTV